MVKKKIVKKTAIRKQNSKKTRTRKEPSSSQLFSKVIAVSESTKTISNEIKNMTKIFKENQKILVAMNDMIDTLSSSMIQIQKQSKQINIIEEDTERLFSGLNQMKGNTKIITKLNEQTVKLEEKIKSIEQSHKSTSKTDELVQTVSESLDSIRNNSKMIMKVADRVDDLKDEIKTVAKEARSTSGITEQIDDLRNSIKSISNRTGDIGKDMSNIKNEIGGIVKDTNISSVLGDGLKTFKTEIEEKISGLSNLINRSDSLASEFHKKTDKVVQEIEGIKNVTNKASNDNSKEVLALLKLSEYQSGIRMNAESKYGDMKDIEKMTADTIDIINLFDKLSIESNEKIPLPHEVRQWAVGKIFDCADKWELRFSEVFQILVDNLGKELLKEAVRIQQVRDIFGIRAVDEIRNELNIS
jgi:methyl-accepting chemotaxis protein